MAVVIGEAAITVRADASGTAEEIQDKTAPAAEKAGEDAGDRLGEKLKLGAAAGLAGLGAAFAASLEQEALGDKLAAQLGASGDYAEDLGSIAGELYADAYGDSLGTVNDALRSVIQSGAVMEDATNEQLQSVTASALNLAEAFDVDVAQASNAAGRLVQTGLASSAEEAFDIITRGFQQGANRGDDFLDVIGEYGTTFQELGVDGAQATGLITQALAAGIPNADFAADALREMGIIAREGTEEAATALGDLGLSADSYFSAMREGGPAASAALDTVLDALRNTEDPALRAQAATALVGTQYEDLGDAILAMDPSEATRRLGEVEGAAGRLGDTLNDNASTNLTSFWREAQTAFVDVIGGQVIPVVQSITGWLRDNLGPALSAVGGFISDNVVPPLRDLTGWLGENDTLVAALSYTIGTVLVGALIVWGTRSLIAAGQAVIAWVTTAAAATTSAGMQNASALQVVAGWVLMGAQSLIQAARMAAAWLIALGPIGIVIAAVVGLVALIIANWETVKNVTVGAFRAVVGAISNANEWVKANWPLLLAILTGPIGLAVLFITRNWNTIVSAISNGFNAVVGFVTSIPGRILSALGNLGSLLYGAGADLIRGLVNGIASAASFVGNVAKNVVNAVIDFVNRHIIGGINNLLEFTIMGVRVNPPDIPRIPRLHSGGIFDSGDGEGLALLRDQERVITPEQRVIADNLLARLLSGALPTPSAAGAAPGGVQVTNNITQQPGEDGAVLAARVTQGTVWNLNAGITRTVGATL